VFPSNVPVTPADAAGVVCAGVGAAELFVGLLAALVGALALFVGLLAALVGALALFVGALALFVGALALFVGALALLVGAAAALVASATGAELDAARPGNADKPLGPEVPNCGGVIAKTAPSPPRVPTPINNPRFIYFSSCSSDRMKFKSFVMESIFWNSRILTSLAHRFD
jgi:hypothetical protein